MKIGLRFINTLLAIAIVVAGSSMALNKMLDHKRLQEAASNSGAYETLATALPPQLASDLSQGNPAVQARLAEAIAGIMTPGYVKAKFDSLFDQFESIKEGEGESMSIDFTDLRAQLRAQGIALPADQLQPLVFQKQQVAPMIGLTNSSAQIAQIAIIAAVVLLVISLLMSFLSGSYRSLGFGLLTAGIILGLIILLITAVISSMGNNMNLEGPINVLTPSIQKLLAEISGQVRNQFGIGAAAIAILGLLLAIFSGLLPKHHAAPKAHK